nr:PREDICTED: SH3 domain and tetratricopeptide repeat-containing protein 2 isoform X2 [Apteryx mantelli mantelli]
METPGAKSILPACLNASPRNPCSPGEECDCCCPSSPALLSRWDHLQHAAAERRGKWWQEKTMASGNAGEPEPTDPATEAAEGLPDNSSVLLAVGEGFPPEISLFFSVESRSSRCLNSQLQEAVRKKLWALENDDREVCALFKELSARLVCVQAQEDRFLLTFKTLEEIWKFSTYLTLGYVASCLEQLLFDQVYWLNCALMEDTEIKVTVNEDRLATIYLGLLLQEGNFFSRAVPSVCQPEEEAEDGLRLYRNELIHVKNVGEDSKWEGTSLLTGQRGLVPVTALEPVPHPFYQWFLKNHAVSFGISQEISGTTQPIVKGRCTAKEDHRGGTWDELSFSKGDSIEVFGFLIPGLPWFVGKSLSSGNIGFVPTRCINPEACEPLGKGLVFLSEEEKVSLLRIPCNGSEQHFAALLSDLARTDITSVYRLDGFEPTATFPKIPSEAVLQGYKDIQLLQSWEEINSLATPSTSEKSSPGSESAPATLEDIFLEKPDDFDDPKFFIDLNVGHMEDADVFDPILTFLNQDSYVPNFESLYDLSFSFLSSTFYGFSDEDELILYLETSRNWAKRTHSVWAHVRLCFLLGKLCIKKVKFSQARVYFEEALSILERGFGDLPLLAALHVNLASIYLKQNMKHKFSSLLGKTVTLLVCLPGHSFSSENELEVMNYILREAIAVGNAPLEARICFLIVKLLLQLGKNDEVLPFTERLQCLATTLLSPDTSAVPLDATPILSYLYDKKYLPNIALASARLFVPSGVKGTPTPIWRAGFILQNTSKLLGSQLERSSIPAVACFYLKQALNFSCDNRAVPTQRTLCAILSRMYLQHGMLDGAVCYAATAVALSRLMSEEEAFESSLCLGWMYLLDSQPGPAAEIMWQLLHSLHGTDSVTQGGAVHNLLAIALKGEGQVQKAAENYLRALHKAKETGNKRNQAITLANLGQLTLSRGASQLSEIYLLQSAELYAELQGTEDLEMELGRVLLWLAQAMINRQRIEDGRLCYELALLFALKWHNVSFTSLSVSAISTAKYPPISRPALPTMSTGYLWHNSSGTERWKAMSSRPSASSIRLWAHPRDQLQELVAFHRLATVYYFLQMYEMAEDCYLKTLALHSPLLQCTGEALYYSKVYCHLGNLTLHKLKDEQDAAGYFLLALAAATEVGDQELQGIIHAKLGRIYSAPLCHMDTPGCTMYRARWLSEGGHVV